MFRILFITILLIFSCEERESEDCSGVVGGDAKEDNCKVCDTDSSNDCIQDCAGIWGGTAVIGGCDSTCNSVAEVDDCDICTGNIYYVAGSCYDCNDVPNGPASLDNCDICDDDPTNDCEADCAGVFEGTQLDTNSDGTCDAVIDIDENIYMTITIGEQVWISENIKVTHYNNQEEILNGNSEGNWVGLSDGAYAVYPFDNGDASTCGENCANVYGNLYNWYAVNDERGICPAGWHVPTDDDYTVLTNNLGGSSVAGGKMKETGVDHWDNPNLGATNESGFTALPSGYYSSEGFNHLINTGYFWSSTNDINYNTQAFGQFVDADTESISRITSSKFSYYSIRCLKD